MTLFAEAGVETWAAVVMAAVALGGSLIRDKWKYQFDADLLDLKRWKLDSEDKIRVLEDKVRQCDHERQIEKHAATAEKQSMKSQYDELKTRYDQLDILCGQQQTQIDTLTRRADQQSALHTPLSD